MTVVVRKIIAIMDLMPEKLARVIKSVNLARRRIQVYALLGPLLAIQRPMVAWPALPQAAV